MANAVDEAVLQLVDARSRALSNNPGLAEMQQRYEALTYIAPQVSTLPDPVLSLNGMNLPWDSFDLQQEPMTQLQLGVSQMFPFPGKLSLREDIAVFEAEAALHSVEEMRLNLDMNVSITWWEIYFLDRSIETVLSNQGLLRQFIDIAKKKYEVGQGLQQDVLLAQLELSKFLDQEVQLKSMREQRVIRLNVLMNVTPEQSVQLPSVMPVFTGTIASESELHQRALAARPILMEEKASISASESRLALAKKDYYPDFMVGLGYGNRQEDDLGRSRQDFLSIMLSVNIPLYTGTKQSQAVQQRARELAKSRYSLVDQRNMVLSSISSAVTGYEQAKEQLSLYSGGILPQARQTVQSMLAGYQVSEVDFLNVVRSQVTLFNYELQYWKSFTEINQSIARLEAAVGEENVYE
ncbi:MAG: transporter [Halioglobus sp.]|nr:transporter [Halioglobus sp.]|tara:strand:- start:17667 stop:18893 length:1227 start_codon:yes stop_codon:yes gene_type:complete